MPEPSISKEDYSAKKVGERIKLLRKAKGLSQEQLAEKLNVSMNTIAKIECGLRKPSIDFLFDLVQFFDVRFDYVLLGVSEEDDKASLIKLADETIEKINKRIGELLLKKEDVLQIKKKLESELE